jgi:hypothetical protein
MLRNTIVAVLVTLVAVSSARAQDRSDLWHTFAERLAPGSFVVVTMKNGKSVQGTLVQVTPDTMTVLPKVRIAVPARTLAFEDIGSIDVRREGMSPGAKVLLGVGSAAGLLITVVVLALAGSR